jgi:putative hydrolase of the HAD superfamily
MTLRLVLFDLWGTLFAYEGPGEDRGRGAMRVRMVCDALAGFGALVTQHDVREAFLRAGEELMAIHADGRDVSAEARTALYMRHVDPKLCETLDDATWQALHRALLTPALAARPAPMPGAVDVLRATRALGLPRGLVSNAGLTPGFVLREIMDGYGLLEHFDDTVFSDEVELSKPAAAIFERALTPFGVAPDEAVFVGDHPVLDVLGPQSAGLWTVQLGDLAEDGIEPHARIARLQELVPALRTLGLLDEPAAAR